ncbi:MAG: AIPR family protein [Methanoregulaceae archaeon]
MTTENEFEIFVENFHHDIIDSDPDQDSELFTEEQFTEKFLQYLEDFSVIEDHHLCRLEGRGFKINAHNSNIRSEIDGDCREGIFYDLFVTIYTGKYSQSTISKSEISSHIKKLRTFFTNAIHKKYAKIEESNPAFDLADTIYNNRDSIAGVRLFILTDGIVKPDPIDDETEGSIRISHQIWDLQRLFRYKSSGKRAEPIEIDFIKEFGEPLECLQMPKDNPQYTSYLAIMPGKMIADLYGAYGPKLLERNIRVFLQMKGKVNKGIRETIRNNPCMFLAYNNGISCTAEKVIIEKNSNSIPTITWIRDFQIVNGAQTTAAIHYTYYKEKCDISDIFVQVKLTVLKNQEDMDVIVPKISEYANSQNKISESDFAANELFHIEIEKISRSIWAHAKRGSQQETHWYYERARGQYQVEKDRQSTAKFKRLFSDRNPTSQRFTKTDLGKYENSWDQMPNVVSLGNQKNFRAFVLRQKETGPQSPDKHYFSLLIAKAILFKKTDKIIKNLNFGPYKGNYVTYTIALLSKLTNKKIDLIKIWNEQEISPALENFITHLASEVRMKITDSPSGMRNISEWCKKKECWDSVQKIKIEIPINLKVELISEEEVRKRDNWLVRNINGMSRDEEYLLETSNDENIPNDEFEKIVE